MTVARATQIEVPQARARREWRLLLRNTVPTTDVVVTRCAQPIIVVMSAPRPQAIQDELRRLRARLGLLET